MVPNCRPNNTRTNPLISVSFSNKQYGEGIPDSTIASFASDSNYYGENHRIILIAQDIGGASVQDTIHASIAAENDPPIISKELIAEVVEVWENDSIKLNSNNPELFNNLGIAYMKIKNFNQAIQSFKRAIEINSHFIEPYNNLGVSLKEVKKINEAIEYFEKAIELETKNPKAYNNIGSIYFETNKFEKFQIILKSILKSIFIK